MARFYATFDNSTVSGLEAASTGNRFQRLAFTNGATLKSALISARSALSAAMYAEMDVANRDGSASVVVPSDGYTRGGGNLSWTNLYTQAPEATWPSNPRTRPTAQITVATTDSTLSDSGSITESLYTDAQTAVQNALAGIAGGGPYARLGLTPWRTLASLWHDHDLTYFAWDDFTPGQPSTVSTNNPADQSAASDLTVIINWAFTAGAYESDKDGTAGIAATLTDPGSPGNTVSLSVDVPASDLSYNWVIPGSTLPAGIYDLTLSVTFKDATIGTNTGTSRTGDVTTYIELT